MTNEELYFWDLYGYLILRGVLTDEEIAAGNAAVDYFYDEIPKRDGGWGAKGSDRLKGSGWLEMHGLMQLDEPHDKPFRDMLVHPAVVSRLNIMCGKGFRLDHGPLIISAIKGTEGLTLHGSGEPHSPLTGYHHQSGQTHCNGVTIQFQLADVGPRDGGFVCVPASHKARYPIPDGVRTCDDDLGVVLQPPTKAGDLIFFMDGAETHGTHRWTAEHQRRSILIKYTAKSAARGVPDRDLFEPPAWRDEAELQGMSETELQVLKGPGVHHGPLVKALDVDDQGDVFVVE
jgi:hypothetical protein